VIEDCAHAIETEHRGRKAGTIGDLGCFSFYVTKSVVAGEGGMVLTADGDLAARIKVLALHGLSADAWKRFSDDGYRHYYVTELGFKYNMTDLQAALALHQLRRVERTWARRREIWQRYQAELADLPLERPSDPEAGSRHAHHLYTVLVDERAAGITRDDLLVEMTASGIGVGVHYLSVAEHPYYRERFGWRPEQWPVAMSIGRRTMSLPLSARLTDDEVSAVITAVRRLLLRRRSARS
jgi:dTDP-4-amino-4,6-dideoxygalactose transaminase